MLEYCNLAVVFVYIASTAGIASQFGFFLHLRCNSGYVFNPQPPGYTSLFVNPSYRCQDNKWTAMFSPNPVLSGKLDCMSKLLFGYSL